MYNQMYQEDDRPINASGSYNIPAYAMDEIEIQEHFDELELADDQDLDQIEQINAMYNQILNQDLELKSQSSFT